MARRKNKNKNKKIRLLARGGKVIEAVTGRQEEEKQEAVGATDFSLVIPHKIYEKVMYWINQTSPNEVSGFGNLDFDANSRVFTVRDAFLLDQQVSSGSAEITAASISRAMFEQRNEENTLKWHWHSHPTFEVFWSGTDMNLIRELGSQGWILATVLNCKRESRTAFHTMADVLGGQHELFIDDIPLEVDYLNFTEEEIEAFDEELAAKVKKPAPYNYNNYGQGGRYAPPAERDPNPSGLSYGDRKLSRHDYDDFGFASINNRNVYNPIFDSEVVGQEGRMKAVGEMTDAEIEFLVKHDTAFSRLVECYRESEAAEFTGH